jgi:micrococcal nuclease
LLIVGALLVCDRTRRTPVAGDDWTRYHDRSFAVTRVVDGDTLLIEARDRDKDVTRIRLWGVDTPELARGKKAGMHFGAEAKAFAERTMMGRRVHVVLSPKRTRGKYGRLLAYVYLDRGGPMFNEMLLEEGYAYADLRFQHHYFKQFKAIEKRARKAGVGLWSGITRQQMPKWKQRLERKAENEGD